MAGNWFLGGCERVEQNANAWIQDTLSCSLVAGTSLAANVRSWRQMQDFLGGGNSFVTGATDVAMPTGRTVFYDSAIDRVRYNWPAGVISLGTPAAAQNFCGILVHDGSVSTMSSNIWAYQRVTGTTTGGEVTWGSAGATNELFTHDILDPSNGAKTGNGWLKNIFYDTADSWSGGTDFYEFALASSGSFDKDWETFADAVSGGMTFCTNCGFGGSANPGLLGLNRANSTFQGSQEIYYQSTQTVAGGLKWDGTGLSSGETAVGILGYVRESTEAASPIFMWNPINPSITTTTGQDIFWDSFDGGSRILMQTSLSGS